MIQNCFPFPEYINIQSIMQGQWERNLYCNRNPVILQLICFCNKQCSFLLHLFNSFKFQEAIKQVWSLEGNCFRTKGGKEKKEKEMIV